MRCHQQISSYRIDLMSVNGPISPKQCYYEMDYSFYSFYWLDSLEIWLDHNSTHYRSLSKNSDVKPHISCCDTKTSNIRCTPSFDLLRDDFSKQVYYKTCLILENWWHNFNEWLTFNSLLGTADIRVHVVHTSRVIITNTLEILSSLT